ncbi:hypothetical protein [Anaerovorax odorimutans]|uniref:hypothetical protein n=1 Tax=Anaerovorax odorimutans TaxID=109327 RepID=UPI00040E6359|nr:hypothetical protein [Anaerovorax odorimutans]
MKILNRNKWIGLLVMVVFVASSATAFAASYTNKVTFSEKLPMNCHNTTVAQASKTTSEDYGRVQITNTPSEDGIACWFRTKDSQGNYNYDLDELVFIKDKKKHHVNYGSDVATGKKTKAELRMENETLTQYHRDTVKGNVWFN